MWHGNYNYAMCKSQGNVNSGLEVIFSITEDHYIGNALMNIVKVSNLNDNSVFFFKFSASQKIG
jgi:hypothetical protein